jgi:hypothetical protein
MGSNYILVVGVDEELLVILGLATWSCFLSWLGLNYELQISLEFWLQ